MWNLIFLFINIINLFSLIYPFLVKIDVKFNIIRLKGAVIITLFNKIKLEYKVRIKHGYVYINHKAKERKEKISNKNAKIMFIMSLINQLYFREQFLDLDVISNFGYNLDSRITAVGCGYIDVLVKSLLGKLKNNKKSSHIFVSVEPKYNQDIFNVRVTNVFRISIWDMLYTLIYTKFIMWREQHGKQKLKEG